MIKKIDRRLNVSRVEFEDQDYQSPGIDIYGLAGEAMFFINDVEDFFALTEKDLECILTELRARKEFDNNRPGRMSNRHAAWMKKYGIKS